MKAYIKMDDLTEHCLLAKFVGKINRCYAFQKASGGLMLFERCRKELVDVFSLDSDKNKERFFGIHYVIFPQEIHPEADEYYSISELVILKDQMVF